VFTTIDTAVRAGNEYDGMAKINWTYNRIGTGPALTILDWDIITVEGALLESWLPSVFRRGEELAKQCGARFGYLGARIERHGSPVAGAEAGLAGEADRYQADGNGKGRAGGQLIRLASCGEDKDKPAGIRQDYVVRRCHPQSFDAFCYGAAIALGNVEGW
jgi:hypothetical protein